MRILISFFLYSKLAANSWGEDWGIGGLFKIARGINESGIEGNVQSVRAVLLNQYPANVPKQINNRWFYDKNLA